MPLESEDASGSEMEGELSLNSHAAFATNYVQQAVTGRSSAVLREMDFSLHALRQALISKEKVKGDRQTSGTQSPAFTDFRASPGLKLPPMALAMSCLERLRGSTLCSASVVCKRAAV